MLFWAAMITNAERKLWPGDVPIIHFKRAGLPIASMVRTAKLATLESASAERIGRLSNDEFASVRDQIRGHLGLA